MKLCKSLNPEYLRRPNEIKMQKVNGMKYGVETIKLLNPKVWYLLPIPVKNEQFCQNSKTYK